MFLSPHPAAVGNQSSRCRTGGLAAATLSCILVAAGTGCVGGTADENAQERPRESKACTLLTVEEIESFVGETVHAPRPDESEGVADTCRWGDSNPEEPGRIVSLTLEPAGAVEDVRPAAGDNVYEVPALGEGAQGFQVATGGVRVVFAVGEERVDLTYDVVPRDAQEPDAIDRLIRLAGRVRDRLAAPDMG